MAEEVDKKRVRSCLEEEEADDFPEVKKLRDDLLDNIEDEDISSTSADLDSFMKSFEDEISSSNMNVSDLGYLLEASDDELGLPPSKLGEDEVAELVKVSDESSAGLTEVGGMWGFEEFDFGRDLTGNGNGVGENEFVAIDGLFDYSDVGFGSADFVTRADSLPDFVSRPESLPAK